MEELVLQYGYLPILWGYLDKKMEILKECHRLYQCYYETWNSYLNVYLSKIIVLFSYHENHLQTIFLAKNIAYLSFYFLSQYFLNFLFRSLCKEYYSLLLWSLVINRRCITLEIAKDLNTVILKLSEHLLKLTVSCATILRCFLFLQNVWKIFYVLKIFIIRKTNTKYFNWLYVFVMSWKASLAKWLSVRSPTKWFWVRVQLQSLSIFTVSLLRSTHFISQSATWTLFRTPLGFQYWENWKAIYSFIDSIIELLSLRKKEVSSA